MEIEKRAFILDEKWVKKLEQAVDSQGHLNYETFSRLALFDPTLGYYSQSQRERVAKTDKADFYTASSHSEVFPELVVEATQVLLERNGFDPSKMVFCELGAEPGKDTWENLALPFQDYKILGLGSELKIPENAIVYSNELFDAQPFHRWVSVDGQWKPIHLKLTDNQLCEVLACTPLSDSESNSATLLPTAPSFEYHLDLSTDAIGFMQTLTEQPWSGLLIAFDYGMMWKQLSEETPQGTARAYKQHQQSSTLCHFPGEQDLTTHVCWDHLEQVLVSQEFESIQLRSQSRFLMEESKNAIEKIVTQSQSLTDKRKSQLLELISPGFFGQKFQVLSGIRK